MASNLRVDSIVPATGSSVSIGTATGGVNIPGVLTYEDVTNVDSVGVITARSGIRIGATGANTLITGNGTGIGIGTASASSKLHIESSGETSITFEGSSTVGAALQLKNNSNTANHYNQILGADAGGQTTSAINFYNADNANNEGFLSFITRPSGGAPTERLRIGSAGQFGIGGANYGTSGQVLTSAGSGSAVQWATPSAGGFTLLSTTTITNNSTSISLSLSGYQHLYGTVTGLVGASALGDCFLRFNSDSGTNYPWYRNTQAGNEGRNTGGDRDSTSFYLNGVGFAGWPDSENVHRFTLFDVNSGARKLFEMFSVGNDPSYIGHPLLIMTHGQYKSTSAITSLQLSGSTAFTGGVVKLYGIK